MEFPNIYARPGGRLFLAQWQGQTLGMGAFRHVSAEVCELKRIFVRPMFRRERVGRKLVMQLIRAARLAGYRRMRLDTLPNMHSAIRMYRAFGFVPIAPYRPEVELVYMGLRLRI